MEIENWLRENELDSLIDSFSQHQIVFDSLNGLNDDRLREMNVPIGLRVKLEKAISEIHRIDPEDLAGEQSGELRYVSVIMVDIVGSTNLALNMDQESYSKLINEYRRICDIVISGLGGEIRQFEGDGLLAYFGFPIAHEDDASRAILAGEKIISELQKSKILGVSLRCRCGIATGTNVLIPKMGDRADQYGGAYGETPTLSKLIQDSTPPSAVYICDRTLAGTNLERQFDRVELGIPYEISKNRSFWSVNTKISDTIRNDSLCDSETYFVGRDYELDYLKKMWNGSMNGNGRFIILQGEAGVGKTRLVREFRNELQNSGSIQISLICDRYSENTPFYPIIQFFLKEIEFARAHFPSLKRISAISTILSSLTPNPQDHLEKIARLLGLDEDEYSEISYSTHEKFEIIESLTDLLVSASKRNALFIVVEDVHWLDPSSIDVLSSLCERMESNAILCIATTRLNNISEFQDFQSLSVIDLKPLSESEVISLVKNIASDLCEVEHIIDHVLAKSEGVPLYVIELAKHALLNSDDSDALSGERATSQLLQGAFLSRLDKISCNDSLTKYIAQTISVYGKCISSSTLTSLLSDFDTASINKSLELLESEDILNTRANSGEVLFEFTHLLLSDVVYRSILNTKLESTHFRISKYLANNIRPGSLYKYEDLAYHLQKAGRVEQSIKAWHQAGRMSVSISSLKEAISSYCSGLKQFELMDGQVGNAELLLTMTLELGDIYRASDGSSSKAALACFIKSESLARTYLRDGQSAHACYGQFAYHFSQSEFQKAFDAAGKLHLISRGSSIDALNYQAQGLVHFAIGNVNRSKNCLIDALTFRSIGYDRYLSEYSQFPYAALSYLIWCFYITGDDDHGKNAINSGLEYLESATKYEHALFLANICYVYQWTNDNLNLSDYALKLFDFSRRNGFYVWEEIGSFFLKLVEFDTNQNATKSLDELMRFLNNSQRHDRQYFLTTIADRALQLKDAKLSKMLLNQALKESAESGEIWYVPEIHRAFGKLHYLDKKFRNANNSFKKSALAASKQKSPLWQNKLVGTVSHLHESVPEIALEPCAQDIRSQISENDNNSKLANSFNSSDLLVNFFKGAR